MSIWGILLIIIGALFLLTVIIYWFNLDSKLVRALQALMEKHYDNLPRDRKL